MKPCMRLASGPNGLPGFPSVPSIRPSSRAVRKTGAWENLRRFWELVTSGPRTIPIGEEPMLRRFFNEFSASLAATIGVNGFYKPQLPNPITLLSGRAPIAFYDTSPLIETLENLIDFDLINGGPTRLSVGAVEIETANFRYFDSTQLKNRGGINALHIAASGALPPGFPPIEIEGRHYWDGGLVSNTPLQWIMDRRDHKEDICVFQVDLFSAAGHMPRDMLEAAARVKRRSAFPAARA